MLAHTIHARRSTSVDVHQVSGSETTASDGIGRNALAAGVAMDSGGSAGSATISSSAAQQTAERTLAPARLSANSITRETAATTPPCHTQLRTVSMSAPLCPFDQFPDLFALGRIEILVLEHVQY